MTPEPEQEFKDRQGGARAIAGPCGMTAFSDQRARAGEVGTVV